MRKAQWHTLKVATELLTNLYKIQVAILSVITHWEGSINAA